MKLLIVDTFYGPYLQRLYADGRLSSKPWNEQHKTHFAGGFGTGDAYSHGLGLLGVPAIEIVANSTPLQKAWAREHRPELMQVEDEGQQLLAILEAQIGWWQPTVLYVQDINWMPGTFLKHVKPLVQLVVGQNACPLAPNLDLTPYDLLLTSLPHYVGRFRKQGVDAAYFPIGFDQRLLQRHATKGHRRHALTFVGGLGGYHSKGTQMLEAIAQELPLQVWGYGGQQLPTGSTLKQRWQGEAWADDMYALLANSQITLNRHIDIAESYANNMRLYEATGMGACLLTDAKLNLPTLFEPDQEVVTYASAAEAVSKLKQLVAQPQAAAAIAARGQQRTLKEHTYTQRIEELLAILQRRMPLRDVNLPAPALEPQTILVACPANLCHRIPTSIRRAFATEHFGHSFILISDTSSIDTSTIGMKRWCGRAIAQDSFNFEACLDSAKPTQVIFLVNTSSGTPAPSWTKRLSQETQRRQIACTTIIC